MQKSLVRKGLVLGIIVLFVGASVVAIISGNTEKLSIVNDSNKYESLNRGTLTFYTTDDTYLSKTGSPDDPCGFMEWMHTRNAYGSGGSDIFQIDALVKFNVSSIPEDSIILLAKLNLYYYQWHDNNPAGRDLNLYRATSDWDEDTATWNNQPPYASQPTTSSPVPSSTGVWMEWDVTSDVQNFTDGTMFNYGWKVTDENYWGASNIPQTFFRTKEYGDYIPYLEIEVIPIDNVYVDDDYNETTQGWGYDHFDSIQDGIDAVDEGGTVYVYSGTYFEHVTVNKLINLTGEDKNTTIIDGGGSGDVVLLSADGVNISCFTIQNGGSVSGDAGINITSSNSTVMNNNISSNHNGILSMVSSYNNVISCNNVMNNFNGINLWHFSNSTISNNNIYDNDGEGLYLWDYSSNTILNNTIYSNDKNGIYLDAYGGTTINNIVSDNNISSNGYNGIFLRYADNNTITENIIQNNPKGIWFSIHSGNICQNNVVYHNNFIDNAINAYDEGINTWYNSTLQEGNYYDDYNGTDSNGDGIGDIPYDISGGSNQDLYPLMQPWGEMPPVANFSYEINDLVVTFNASFSYDRDGEITTWLWNFGDGVEGVGEIVEYTYSEGGTFEVTLTVIDDDGYEGQITKSIEVEAEYEFERMILLGRITNLNIEEDIITFEAVNLRAIMFSPFSFNLYISGEIVTISKDYFGLVGARFIIALCDASIGI